MFHNIDKDLIKPYNFIMIIECREIIEFLDKADKKRLKSLFCNFDINIIVISNRKGEAVCF